MAAAILVLSWDATVKIRVLLLAGGMLEFSYRDRRSSGVPGAVILKGREVDPTGYTSADAHPRDGHRYDVEKVTIAADIAAYDHASTDYRFYGHQAITEVTGMGNLRGVREMQYTFNSCEGLTEADFSGLGPSSPENPTYTFGGCGSLVTIWVDAGWAPPSSGISGFQTFCQCA